MVTRKRGQRFFTEHESFADNLYKDSIFARGYGRFPDNQGTQTSGKRLSGKRLSGKVTVRETIVTLCFILKRCKIVRVD